MKQPWLTRLLYAAVLLAIFVLYTQTDPAGAKRVLTQQGYKPVQVGGLRFFGGGLREAYRTNFRAVSVSGDTVSGYVGHGFFPGSQIHLD